MPLGGQHTRKEDLSPDYVLFIRRNIPIAVVEAKADYKNAADGLAQVETGKELSALTLSPSVASGMPSVLDKAFEGEL